MKSAHKKLLGLSIGERSFMIAEVTGGDKPEINRLAEMVFPDGVTLSQPAELGVALGHFLKEQHFASRNACIGIPVRWIVVKPKDVPPTDQRTLAPLLRLQAEAEFSTELKDLVYDFVAAPDAEGITHNVLLLATPKKYLEFVDQLCDAARLRAIALMPSALALGEASQGEENKNVMVLAVSPGGSELTIQRGGVAGSIRSLRGSETQPAFVSDLRRAVSSVPGTDREIVLWDAGGVDADALGQQLGVSVRSPELSSLGVGTTETGLNGDGSKYAAAVALALSPMSDDGSPMDFLHSRLAPPKAQIIPTWAMYSGLAAIVIIGLSIWAYISLSNLQNQQNKLNSTLTTNQPQITQLTDFKNQVLSAERWRGGDPRYLNCLRDLTIAMPQDRFTYLTTLDLKDVSRSAVGTNGAANAKATGTPSLQGKLDGRTNNVQTAQVIADRILHSPSKAFSDVHQGGTTLNQRTRETTFSITFTYTPGKISQ